MNKKTLKIIIALLTIMLCISVTIPVYADNENTNTKSTKTISPSEITGTELDANAANQITGIGNQVAGIIRGVGIVLTVIVLMVLGIKYIMGSAQEKAEYKKTMIPYIIGVALLLGASQIAGMVVSMIPSAQ